ncbi:AAA family ATPase [Microbacterium sp. SA39]|uniref:AAA family ATPase n=1 Tax=Microbacterium sp. SA39 TaxID=1263625 RepID=UPI000B15FF7D|nr:ATP-binding protein [Microbacterium sp. SA39]
MYEHPCISHQVTRFEQEQIERAAERRRFLREHADQIVPRPAGPIRRMLRRIVGGGADAAPREVLTAAPRAAQSVRPSPRSGSARPAAARHRRLRRGRMRARGRDGPVSIAPPLPPAESTPDVRGEWDDVSMPSFAPSFAMVGRDAELGVVRRLLDGAREGVPAALLVEGEAGIGKSRLLREFTAEIASKPMCMSAGASISGRRARRTVRSPASSARSSRASGSSASASRSATARPTTGSARPS